MGIDYSYEVGFGFADTTRNYGDLPGGLDYEAWSEGEVDKLLAENGLNLLVANTGGNMMSGPLRWSILVKRTHVRRDIYDSPEITRFTSEDITDEELAQLGHAANLLGVAPAEMSWMFFCNVR